MKAVCFLLLLCVLWQRSLTQHKCQKDFLKTKLLNSQEEVSVLMIWFPTTVGSQNILSICSRQNGLPLQRQCGYDRLNKTGKWEKINENLKLINCSSVSNLCMEESFEHSYIMRNNRSEFVKNNWKAAKIGERADLEKPCLQSSGLPLTRLCKYNPWLNAAQWELLSPEMRNISCLRETDQNLITYDLNTLYQDVKSGNQEDKPKAIEVVRNMTKLLTDSQAVRIPADIKLTGDILKIITEDDRNLDLTTEVLNITSILMAENQSIIIKSEDVLATSNFLKTIDNYFHKMAKVLVPTNQCESTTDGVVSRTIERASVFYVNPACSNISGLAIYTKRNNQEHHHNPQQPLADYTSYNYRFLYMNQTLEGILSDHDLLLAAYFPLSLWTKLKNEFGSIDDESVLTFTIFQNDKLFVNRTRMDKNPRENILEIKISNFTGELPEDIPFLYNYSSIYQKSNEKPGCGYWNYTTWVQTGLKQTTDDPNKNILLCHSTHLTHFGALFGYSFATQLSLGDTVMLRISHDLVLDYITILGCGLSLLGLSCIWLTAMCFKSFRANPSNKVLLNMSFVLSLLMAFFLLINLPQDGNSIIDTNNTLHCQIMGAFLHYIVTVLFLWMLIIAIMQYQRYVKVLGYERPTSYIMKFAILAWGLPLIPVAIVAYQESLSTEKRALNNTNICYPSGDSLKYGVILPMAVIMIANLGIFVYIFFSLRRSLTQFEHRNARKNIVIQVRISVLLFFLLGISWFFGLLSRLENSPVFSYLFCLTSTLQGFVLFLYSIIIDAPTRLSWIVFCCAKSYKTIEDKRKKKLLRNEK